MFASHVQTVLLIESLVLGAAGGDPQRSESALATLNSLRHELAGVPIDVGPSRAGTPTESRFPASQSGDVRSSMPRPLRHASFPPFARVPQPPGMYRR